MWKWIPFLALLAIALTGSAQQPANTLNVVADGGAAGDGVTDDAAEIQAILDAALAQAKDLYFPPGTYVIGADITTRQGVSLYGDRTGLSIIRSAPGSVYYVGNRNWSDPSSNVDVEDLHFLNCFIDWYGSESVRRNLNVRRCLFFANDPAFSTTVDHAQFQIALGHVVDGTVEDCIFLRQSNSVGESVSGYRNVRQTHRHCVWGLHLDRAQWLETQWPRYSAWTDLLGKLQTIRTQFGLTADQGYFRRGIKINDCTGSRVAHNIFNGSPYTPVLPVNRDHVVYAHGGYTDLELLSNWMRGWPSAPNGGLKIRNTVGTSTVIANYFVNTPLLQYAYDNNDPMAYENAIVHRNHFEIYQNFSDARLGISFWETVAGIPPQTNNEYSSNVFECPKAYGQAINLTNGDLTGHTGYDSNVYLSDGTPVSTAHQSGSFALVPGAPASSRTAPYDSYQIPMFDIPVFTTPPAFTADPVVAAGIEVGQPYSGTLSGHASDPDGETLEFMKMSGPEWLSVAWSGGLSGTPGPGDIGLNRFTVRVGDNHDGMDEAELRILVASTNGQIRLTYAPVADAYTSHENPDAVYGTQGYLNIRSDAYGTGFTPYLKFTVPASDLPVAEVNLLLYCWRGTHRLLIHEVADTTWTESGITWNNAPAFGPNLFSRVVGTDAWETFDVSGYVTGEGTYSFGLGSDSASYRRVDSREGTNFPVLEIVYWDPLLDTDVDGMPDWWEDLHFGGPTNAISYQDVDHDHHDNLSEYISGCDPTNSASFFAVAGTTDGESYVVSWEPREGRVYDVSWRSDLMSDHTSMVQSNMAYPQGSCTQVIDQAEGGAFYQGTVRLQ